MKPKTILGAVLVLAGVILAAFFWSQEILWFQGGPIGLVLIALGAWDLFDSYRGARRDTSSKSRHEP